MKQKILVVDNHPLILKFMSTFLEKEGHQVLTAENSLLALDILKTWVPEIIFIDLVMPNIKGEKLCQIIRNSPRLKGVRLVILSAIAAESNIDFARFGADACIAKGPFNKMAKHVLTVMDRLSKGGGKDLSRNILGLNEIHRREITKELLASTRHFETILTVMTEGILELSPDLKIVYANPAAVQMTGIPEHQLLASTFMDMFDGENRMRIESLLFSGCGKSQVITEEDPIHLADREVALHLLPVKSDALYRIIIIINDVTEKRRMKRNLQQAQRMETLATLSGGIAHQFNNALSGITGNIELLEMVLPEESGVSKYVQPMNKSVQRMVDLTNQLLAYARGGKYAPQTISLWDFIKQSLPKIQQALQPVIDLKLDSGAEDCLVRADLIQMEMVLSALIANADEARQNHGWVRIGLRNINLAEDFTRYAEGMQPGNYACLTVEDNGRGMDEETRCRIFEPFFSTKFQGRGLSMAAVYGIIKSHDGWITVDSEEAGGTVVQIYLPVIKREPAAAPAEIPAEKRSVENSSGTVVVVEDEEMNIELLRTVLQQQGYRVLEARSGIEAVKMAETYAGDIDLAILDFVLPDMNGREVFELITKSRPNIRVIFSTGYMRDDGLQEILETGSHAFLQKPFSLKTFAETVKKVMAGR